MAKTTTAARVATLAPVPAGYRRVQVSRATAKRVREGTGISGGMMPGGIVEPSYMPGPTLRAGDVGVLRLVREAGPAFGASVPIRGPRDVAAFLAPKWQDAPAESFLVLALDGQHAVIGGAPIEVTRGLLNSALVHPREVFRAAILAGAAAVILAHNHPSGDPTPSALDLTATAELVAAGKLLGIPVTDHVIIGRGRWVSFAETGLL